MLVRMRRFGIVFMLLTLTAWSGYATGKQDLFEVESSVNGEIISKFDVYQRMKLLQIFRIDFKKDIDHVKTMLIEEQLQLQFARNVGVKLTNDEINKTERDFLLLKKINKKHLIDILGKNDVSQNSFKNFIQSKALWKKALLKSFGNKAIMSDYELNLPPKTYEQGRKKLIDLSEIVIPFSQHGKEKALLLAKRLKIELDANGDFSAAAKRFSRSQSRQSGGKIGLVEEKKLPNELQVFLSRLSIGEISQPVISDKSIILFKINDRDQVKIVPDLDYLMEFSIVQNSEINGVTICKNDMANVSKKSVLLSKLEKKIMVTLRKAELFTLNQLGEGKWVVLCGRSVRGTTTQINKKKSKHFNQKMIAFSKQLMTQLFREAVIQ